MCSGLVLCSVDMHVAQHCFLAMSGVNMALFVGAHVLCFNFGAGGVKVLLLCDWGEVLWWGGV